MRYVVVAVIALLLGGAIARGWLDRAESGDPIQVIVTQLKTHALVEHERQIAIWYRVCPDVLGVDPQIFVAWPAKLSYELPLGDVRLEREGDRLKVRTSAIRADEPAVPTDFLDYLSTDSLFNFANEQQLVNEEVRKASAIARYLSAYYLRRDASLRDEFARELETLVEHMAGALGVKLAAVDIEIPPLETAAVKLPHLALCNGSMASVNGLPFARLEDGRVSPIGFRPKPLREPASGTEPAAQEPKGIVSVLKKG